MRKNSYERMTIVEQLISVKEKTCEYACKYYDEGSYHESVNRKVYLQKYCHECPLGKVHYEEMQEL